METSTRKLPYIEAELHSKFKAVCAIKGVTMKNAVNQAISDYVAAHYDNPTTTEGYNEKKTDEKR